MEDAFGHCERLVRAADKDRFLATLFAPAADRAALFALYAFNVEMARVRALAREPLPGEIRLQWWHDVLTGERREEGRAHPVAAALIETVERRALPVRPLVDLIDARSFDLYDDPMATLADLDAYADKTSSALIKLAAQVLGANPNPVIDELVSHAGRAYAFAGLLRTFPIHAGRRQLYVPLEMLQRHGAQSEDIFAGRGTVELRAALADLRRIARDHLTALRPTIAAMSHEIVPALLPVAIVAPLLAPMERGDDNPFAVAEIPQWRRQWLLWRAARRPARIAG